MASTMEKLLVIGGLALQPVAASCSSSSSCPSSSSEAQEGSRLVQLSHDVHRGSPVDLSAGGSTNIGKAGCQCVGIDWPEGWRNITLDGKHLEYPTNLGTSCEPWDFDRHPGCRGARSSSWCRRQWCFVDPCHCNLTTPPKVSTYLPETTIQGRQLYYSYATCGDKDTWTQGNELACVNQKTEADCYVLSKCAWTKSSGCLGKEFATSAQLCDHTDESVYGDDDCKCIGLSPTRGSIDVTIDSKSYRWPAAAGSSCQSWDAAFHPSCNGTNKPAWCSQKWCYVDPCRCSISTPPKGSTYIPGAMFQGKPLYYSYGTCGQEDRYSASLNVDACPNFKSEQQCAGQSKCGWTDSQGCVQKELMDSCGFVVDELPSGAQPGNSGARGLRGTLLALAAATGLAAAVAC